MLLLSLLALSLMVMGVACLGFGLVATAQPDSTASHWTTAAAIFGVLCEVGFVACLARMLWLAFFA